MDKNILKDIRDNDHRALSRVITQIIDNKDIVRKRPYTPMRLHDAFGNPIGSLDGAVDVHNADVHTIPVNEYFSRYLGIEDTLAVAASVGDTSVIVTNGA